jgi:two-component system response regulator FixJ
MADILIVDDELGMRQFLTHLLQREGHSVRVAENGREAVARLHEQKPDLILSDVRMPEMSGIDLLKRLRQMKNQVPVIIITGHGDVRLAVEAMKCGASDFLEKPFDDELLLTAVRTALSNQVAEHQNQALRLNIEQRIARLSARERQVLDGLVAGHPNKTIAFDLGISPRTIEIYRANVMSKMEAASLSDLVRMALTVGILGQDPGTDSPPGSG